MYLGLGIGLTMQQGAGDPPTPVAPTVNSVTITGTHNVGQVQTAVVSVTGYPPATRSYQWKLAGGNVGTDSPTYTPVATGDLTCVVTATNSEGSDNLESAAVTIAAALAAPVNTASPVISGSTSIPSTLTATTGTWTGNPAPGFAYQWRRDGANISGATASTYATTVADDGAAITCLVTASNSEGSASAGSNTITPAVGPALPSITGNGSGTVDINVDDGTFSVTVSGSDYAHQNGTFGPFNTADLDSGPVLVVAPVISGSAVEGSTLTAEPGLWVHDAADGTTTVTAIWQADGVDISGETGTTYVTVGGDVGAEITYEEEATNDAGTRTSDSNGITVIVAPSDGDAALLETGDTILLENGDRLLLDVIPSIALLENGDNILLETGDNMLLEA